MKFHVLITSHISTVYGLSIDPHIDQLPVGLIAQLVEHCPSEFGPPGANPLEDLDPRGLNPQADLVPLRGFGPPILQLIYLTVYRYTLTLQLKLLKARAVAFS